MFWYSESILNQMLGRYCIMSNYFHLITIFTYMMFTNLNILQIQNKIIKWCCSVFIYQYMWLREWYIDTQCAIFYPFNHFQSIFNILPILPLSENTHIFCLAIFIFTDHHVCLSWWYGVLKMYWFPPRIIKTLCHSLCTRFSESL